MTMAPLIPPCVTAECPPELGDIERAQWEAGDDPRLPAHAAFLETLLSHES